MSEEEARKAEHDGDDKRARKLRQRMGAGPRWRTLDNRVVGLHEVSDDHLVNRVKFLIRKQLFSMEGATFGSLPVPRVPEMFNARWKEFEARHAAEIQELEDRNSSLDPFNYFCRVWLMCCDECGSREEHSHVVKVRAMGPTKRIQCEPCAENWEARCPKCGKKSKTFLQCDCGAWVSWMPKEGT